MLYFNLRTKSVLNV